MSEEKLQLVFDSSSVIDCHLLLEFYLSTDTFGSPVEIAEGLWADDVAYLWHSFTQLRTLGQPCLTTMVNWVEGCVL